MGEERPTEAAVQAWARLVRIEQALLDRIEEDLKSAGLPPLVWYDVLLELVREPGDRLRHRDLHRRMLLAKYNLSRLLDRMEADGLIGRQPVNDDARGEYVRVTTRGRDTQKRMWPVYRRAIARHFSSRLSIVDIDQLLRILSKVSIENENEND
jgi:DNA-binding MarR family transcriptional regulator